MRVSLCCIDQTRFVQQEWRTSVQWLELSDGTKMYNMYWPAYVMQTGGQYNGWLDAIAQLVLMFQLLRLINIAEMFMNGELAENQKLIPPLSKHVPVR
jgi:hypothetical protein